MQLRALALATVTALTALGTAAPASAATLTVLRHFSGADGSQPMGALAIDGQGNLYGSTQQGGASNFGTLFRWDGSSFTTLHQFTGGPDGGWPFGGLLADGEGNFYGTTRAGGSYGTVFRWDRERTPHLRTIKNFIDRAADGVQPHGGLARDADGTVYGTTVYGGNLACGTVGLGCGSVFSIAPNGTFRQLYRFNGPDGYAPAATLLRQGDRLWGTTIHAGPAWAGSPFSLKTDGSAFATVTPPSLAYNFTGGLVADAAGNRWGAALVGGTRGLGVIYRIDTTGRFTAVYSFSGPDGAYPAATPVIDGKGMLYGTTQGNGNWAVEGSGPGGVGTVWQYDTTTGVLTTLHRFTGPDGKNPTSGLVRSADGSLYGTTPYGGIAGKGVMFKLVP